jgi:hypothetical protein
LSSGRRWYRSFSGELGREPVPWFEALKAISGEDRVPREDWGKIPAMAAAWLAWGRTRGLI